MKCLEKDRNRRYETASALAADVMHYLADEPVTAGPPSQLYRARKFVRRNRVPVVAALLVAAAILGGVAASTWQAVRATRAERAALASAKLAQQSATPNGGQGTRGGPAQASRRHFQLSDQRLHGAIPGARYPGRRRGPRALGAELQDAYPDDPGADAALLATMGRSYVGLRRFGDAEQIYRKCLSVAKDPGLIDRVRRELATCLLR